MNVASLKLCNELYEASKWDSRQYFNIYGDVFAAGEEDASEAIPAYDLGYLLRKLPGQKTLKQWYDETWELIYAQRLKPTDDVILLPGFVHSTAETPEDAAAKLAIELFKQGILKPNEEQ